MRVNFYRRNGSVATKDEFLSDIKRDDRNLGTYIHKDRSEIPLIVHAYFSGVNHGNDKDGNPKIYEVAINGDPANSFHRKYAGKVWQYHAQAEAAAQYTHIVDVIKSGGRL